MSFSSASEWDWWELGVMSLLVIIAWKMLWNLCLKRKSWLTKIRKTLLTAILWSDCTNSNPGKKAQICNESTVVRKAELGALRQAEILTSNGKGGKNWLCHLLPAGFGQHLESLCSQFCYRKDLKDHTVESERKLTWPAQSPAVIPCKLCIHFTHKHCWCHF